MSQLPNNPDILVYTELSPPTANMQRRGLHIAGAILAVSGLFAGTGCSADTSGYAHDDTISAPAIPEVESTPTETTTPSKEVNPANNPETKEDDEAFKELNSVRSIEEYDAISTQEQRVANAYRLVTKYGLDPRNLDIGADRIRGAEAGQRILANDLGFQGNTLRDVMEQSTLDAQKIYSGLMYHDKTRIYVFYEEGARIIGEGMELFEFPNDWTVFDAAEGPDGTIQILIETGSKGQRMLEAKRIAYEIGGETRYAATIVDYSDL